MEGVSKSTTVTWISHTWTVDYVRPEKNFLIISGLAIPPEAVFMGLRRKHPDCDVLVVLICEGVFAEAVRNGIARLFSDAKHLKFLHVVFVLTVDLKLLAGCRFAGAFSKEISVERRQMHNEHGTLQLPNIVSAGLRAMQQIELDSDIAVIEQRDVHGTIAAVYFDRGDTVPSAVITPHLTSAKQWTALTPGAAYKHLDIEDVEPPLMTVAEFNGVRQFALWKAVKALEVSTRHSNCFNYYVLLFSEHTHAGQQFHFCSTPSELSDG